MSKHVEDRLHSAMLMASDIGIRLEGLAFLLDSFNPDGHGERDHIAMQGVGCLLADLSKQANKVSNIIDESWLNRDKQAVG